MSHLISPTVGDILYIASRMREDEIEQFLAMTGLKEYDPDVMTKAVLGSMGNVSFVLLDNDAVPYCAGGFTQVLPMVWQTWMMGTPIGWEKNWRDITKYSRRMMDNLLKSGQANRIQCYSLRARTNAQLWYKRGLGMKFESHIEKLFADGQDGTCYVKIKE